LSHNCSCLLPGCQSEDTVDQPLKHVTGFKGELITLDCKYTTVSTSQEHFWYIQKTDEQIWFDFLDHVPRSGQNMLQTYWLQAPPI